jgi:hypothetical protein
MKSIMVLHGGFSDDAEAEKPEAEVDNELQYIDAFGTMAIKYDDAMTIYGWSEVSYFQS